MAASYKSCSSMYEHYIRLASVVVLQTIVDACDGDYDAYCTLENGEWRDVYRAVDDEYEITEKMEQLVRTAVMILLSYK